jgi:hypothetical protein
MKIGGIILIILGSLTTLGGIVKITKGHGTEFSLWGPGLIVIGILLIVKSNNKKKGEQEKKNWIEGDSNKKE